MGRIRINKLARMEANPEETKKMLTDDAIFFLTRKGRADVAKLVHSQELGYTEKSSLNISDESAIDVYIKQIEDFENKYETLVDHFNVKPWISHKSQKEMELILQRLYKRKLDYLIDEVLAYEDKVPEPSEVHNVNNLDRISVDFLTKKIREINSIRRNLIDENYLINEDTPKSLRINKMRKNLAYYQLSMKY